ncbi:aminotransferase-like domain-containing protein [Streptococcus catagoni]|uniref:aminotransferase-like domain-containing protein n=1 Tax=Streptococcus catagoni TaxID=2654874 RepID=UPI001408754E|nr:PLP-dependent aminotransferase family protein [Streptococcus catagoni]
MSSKYQRIIEDISQKIHSGSLKKGDKLPSIRQLSQSYACSKDTVQRALMELKFRNDIYAVNKSGYYVLESHFHEENPIELSINTFNDMAYKDFRLCMTESLVNRENYLFNYYHQTRGLKELIKSLHKQLAKDAVYAKENNILVTSGSQQALYILSQMPFPNGKKTILIEQPTYPRLLDLITFHKLPFQTIERHFEGLDLKKLEEIFSRQDIKFFYTMSRFSNPLGLAYTSSEKQKIVELAERYDVYILEDDYMGDFSKTNELPLHYYDTSEHVIYLKSFSITVFPALRLASLILPESLMELFLKYKKIMDYDTSLIMQKALSIYIDNGMFSKNVHYLNQVFKEQCQHAKELIQSFPEFSSHHILPQKLLIELADKASLNNLTFTKEVSSLSHNYINDCSKPYIQISNNENLLENLTLLRTCLREKKESRQKS